MKLPLCFVCVLCSFIAHSHVDSIEGTYMLTGVREMASVIQLNKDSTFEFFFSYGALDRGGSGSWHVDGSTVILNSKPAPGPIFRIVESTTIRKPGITIRFKDTNPVYYNFLYAGFGKKDTDTIMRFSSSGSIYYPVKTPVRLLLELAPEKEFSLPPSAGNQYVLAVQPWAMEVFFSSFRLQVFPGQLKGKHPFLEGDDFKYERQTDR